MPGADDERWRASIGVGTPEDVVGPLLFLLSDAADHDRVDHQPRLRLSGAGRLSDDAP